MKFKTPALSDEFSRLHPDVIAAVKALDDFSHANRLPELVVTHAIRTPAQQEDIYWRGIAKNTGLPESEARAQARKKFSWHLAKCAVDLRNNHYTAVQLQQALEFLKRGREHPLWEVISHDVGRGNHLHIGRRDFAWQRG